MIRVGFLHLFFLISFSAFAAAPSGEEWFTLVTPNFRVHHTKPLEPYARAYGASLERALPKLEADLKWKAPTPIDVVVTDPSDSANGFAANFPNTHMELYAASFEMNSVLSHYHNWVNELATHELTHIIANDTTRGFYRPLRTVFGSWVKPNGIQPIWMMEGLATYEETQHTSGGRGRSPLMEALLREAVKDAILTHKSYTSIDRFNDGNEWWPGGNSAYLLGYTIQALPVREVPNFPGEASHANADRVPFLPNENARELAGRDWPTIWKEAPARLATRYAEDTTQISSCRLTSSGRFTGGHALSPDGWLYFSEEDFEHGFYLSRVRADAPCESAEVERLYHKWWGGPSQVSVSPDGKRVAFAAFDYSPFERFFSRIYLWHIDASEAEEVEGTLRGRAPALLEDALYFIRPGGDTRESIVRRSLTDGREEVIFTAEPLVRLSGLHARGDHLVFSLHDNQARDRVFLLTRGDRSPSPLLTDEPPLPTHERNPYLAEDGSVYFAASYGYGSQEIHRFDPKTKTAAPILANASGYLDRPIPLPDGTSLLAQAYDHSGLNLARLERSAGLVDRPAAHEEDLHEFLTGMKPPAPLKVSPATAGAEFAVEPYRATKTPATSLWPQYWMPEIVAADGGWLLGASTSGNDPLQYHNYALLAQYDTRADFPIYRAYYQNRTWPTQFFVQAQQSNSYFSTSGTSNRAATYSVEAQAPLGDTLLGFGVAFQERTLFGRQADSFIGFQSFNYTRVGQRPAAIDPNFGFALDQYLAIYPKTQRENLFADIRPSAAFYLAGFRPSHSVSAKASAGITTNSLLASNYYLGGGISFLSPSDFVVRGYPSDTLFGQRIATVNLAYTLPIAHPYRGLGVHPLFFESLGFRFHFDAGSANYLARYHKENFLGYRRVRLGEEVLTGLGVDFVTKGSVFYHVPLEFAFGLHYGTRRSYGGGPTAFLGLNVGAFGSIGTGQPRGSNPR
jgi:hypothetical protein